MSLSWRGLYNEPHAVSQKSRQQKLSWWPEIYVPHPVHLRQSETRIFHFFSLWAVVICRLLAILQMERDRMKRLKRGVRRRRRKGGGARQVNFWQSFQIHNGWKVFNQNDRLKQRAHKSTKGVCSWKLNVSVLVRRLYDKNLELCLSVL